MYKILISFFSLVALLATDGLARPFKCRFRSSEKCGDLSYFMTQSKDGCATPGSKCLVNFCANYCAKITSKEAANIGKFGTNVIGVCSSHCMNTKTLHKIPSHKREALYNLITGSLKKKKTGLRLAQDMERKLEHHRMKRKKGFLGLFKKNPSRSEQLETLRLEAKLRQAYVAEVASIWKRTRNIRRIRPLLQQAAAQLVPTQHTDRSDRSSERARSHSAAQIARRQSALAEEIAVNAGIPKSVAEDAAAAVANESRRGATPPHVAVSPAVRTASAQLSEARALTIPDAPPLPPEGIDAYLAKQRRQGPTSATGTVATSAMSANSVPQYDAVRTPRPVLNAALQDQIKAGMQLRKASPTPSDSGVGSESEDEGRGALLAEIRNPKKKLKKTKGPNVNRVKAPNGIFAGVLARREAVAGNSPESSPEDSGEDSWDDE